MSGSTLEVVSVLMAISALSGDSSISFTLFSAVTLTVARTTGDPMLVWLMSNRTSSNPVGVTLLVMSHRQPLFSWWLMAMPSVKPVPIRTFFRVTSPSPPFRDISTME